MTPYTYEALVTEVYDGDTITVDMDLGFGIIQHGRKVRLYGVDTPEMRGEELERGRVVRDIVRSLILGKEIVIQTILDRKGLDTTGKYGRVLGIILCEKDGEQINLNDYLVENGYAVEYMKG